MVGNLKVDRCDRELGIAAMAAGSSRPQNCGVDHVRLRAGNPGAAEETGVRLGFEPTAGHSKHQMPVQLLGRGCIVVSGDELLRDRGPRSEVSGT